MDRYSPVKNRKEQILIAAMKVFNRKGYHSTTMDDIVKESRLSKGTLYWHFKSKKELFFNLFDYCMNSYVEEINKIISDNISFEENLKRIGWTVFKKSENESEFTNVAMEFFNLALRDDKLKEKFNNLYQKIFKYIRQKLNEKLKDKGNSNTEIEKTCIIFAAIIDGIILYQTVGLIKERPSDIWNFFVENFMKSILKEGDL